MYNLPPYYQQNGFCLPKNPKFKPALIRVLHAAPNTPALNVYANGRLIIRNLDYKQFSSYIEVPAGTHDIRVFPSCGPDIPLISKNISVNPGHVYTIAQIGKSFNIRSLVIPDFRIPPPLGKTYLRFIHLSPNTPPAAITLPNGASLFESVGFKQATNSIYITPGVYALEVRAAGTDNIALVIPDIEFMQGLSYSLYAIGLLEKEPPFQILVSSDMDSSYDDGCTDVF